MKMIAQTIDPHHPDQQARRIRSQASTVLRKWGLLPRFSRWRLSQDPTTGMKVLFGILNNHYIASHTSIPFSNYFDPRLLDDLANEMQVKVVSCSGNDLRYAFILDPGQINMLPSHIDFPFLDGTNIVFRVAYSSDASQPEGLHPVTTPTIPVVANISDDQVLVRRGIEAFLKVFDDEKLKKGATSKLAVQGLPKVVIIDPVEFTQHVLRQDVYLQRLNRIRRLVGDDREISKKMQQAMLYAMSNGGKLRRYRGGFWAFESWHEGQYPWFDGSTVEALVSRGLMAHTEWREGRNGNFPIAVVVLEPPNAPELPNA
jgi:hypothetical protein